jgi:hypothetical protein
MWGAAHCAPFGANLLAQLCCAIKVGIGDCCGSLEAVASELPSRETRSTVGIQRLGLHPRRGLCEKCGALRARIYSDPK